MDQRDAWFNELYLKHRKRLLRTARAMTRGRYSVEDLEDMVEEVFEKLYNKYETVKDHEKIEWWLTKALENQIGSESQKAYRRREVAFDPEFEPAQISRGEDFMSILPPGLSEPERQILYLHIEAGYSHEEIAKIKGCSVLAVRMRYSRARRHCRKLMEENKEQSCHILQESTNIKDRGCSDV